MLLRWRSFLHTDGGVGGDVHVHCIASSEDVVPLKMLVRSRCCYVQDVVTFKMLLRSRCCDVEDVVTLKVLLRWWFCYVEDVVTFKKLLLRSRSFFVEDVVTLKVLLRWRCCYVQEGVTLKLLLRSRSCYVEDVVTFKLLLRWRCCYVEDVVTSKMLLRWNFVNFYQLFTFTDTQVFNQCWKPNKCHRHKVNGACAPTNAFKTALWIWREERLMFISPMVLWWIMTFLCLSKEPMGKAKMT